MRAINLLPDDARRGVGGAGGRSAGAAYVLLALLAMGVVVAAAYTVQKRSVADKRAQVTTLETQAVASEARVAELSSFVEFAGLRASRTETVRSLAASRFDWSHAMRELARVVPADVWLTSLQATVAPGVTLKAAAPAIALRTSLALPAVEITGCTTSQAAVARMVTRMRLIDGVSRVALQSSVKANAVAGGGGDGGDCRQGNARFPQFGLVVFFDQAAGAVPSQANGVGRVVAAQLAPSGATGAQAAALTGATP